MRNIIWTKVLIFGIILLFFGTSIIPTPNGEKLLPDELLLNESLFYDKLDQNNSEYNSRAAIADSGCSAQSFKPTLNMLTRVELLVGSNSNNPQGNITISIRENLSSNDLTWITVPIKDIPAGIPMDIWTEFDFSDISVIPEQTYYIVSSYEPQNFPFVSVGWSYTGTPDHYTRGEHWVLGNQGWIKEDLGSNCDFNFKTYGYNATWFLFGFGIITVDGTIDYIWDFNSSWYNYFLCYNVSKVTVIGFGAYYPELNMRFYKNTLTNVTYLVGSILKRLEVSDEYQHLSIFATRNHPILFCMYQK